MRFHIGCSFRPKQIIKYLFPFLLGLLAMFGIDHVNAQVRDDFTFDYTISEIDFSQNVCGTDMTLQEMFDYVKDNTSDSVKYYIDASLDGSSLSGATFHFRTLSNQNTAYKWFQSWNYDYSTANGSFVNSLHISNSYQASVYYHIYVTGNQTTCSNNLTNWNKIKYFVDNGRYQSSATSTYDYWYQGYTAVESLITNDTKYIEIPSSNISDDNSFIYYDSNYDITLHNSSIQNNNVKGAKLVINGIEINEGDKIPSYVDLQNMGNLDFESVSPQFPYVYFSMNKSQMSSFNAKFTFKPLIDSDTYLSLIGGGQQKYYGRYNHSNYYTYEPINCTLSRSGSVDDSTGIITFNYNNFTCSSDLTNYDKIYIFESTGYEYDQDNLYNHTIVATLLKSNVDSMLSDKYLGTLYEKLDLQFGWKVLFSSYDFPMRYTYFKANHPNVLFDFLNSNDTTSDITFDNKGNLIGGRSYSMLFPDIMTINIDSRYNLMTILYDDIANHSSGNTILEYWFEYPEYVLVSFPTTIDNKDNYVFYDKTGNIVNNNIKTNYGLNNLESYDLNESFKIIDSFFDEIREPMIQLHNINQSVYDIAPDFIKLFVLILYLLFLNSILFKVIRR